MVPLACVGLTGCVGDSCLSVVLDRPRAVIVGQALWPLRAFAMPALVALSQLSQETQDPQTADVESETETNTEKKTKTEGKKKKKTQTKVQSGGREEQMLVLSTGGNRKQKPKHNHQKNQKNQIEYDARLISRSIHRFCFFLSFSD